MNAHSANLARFSTSTRRLVRELGRSSGACRRQDARRCPASAIHLQGARFSRDTLHARDASWLSRATWSVCARRMDIQDQVQEQRDHGFAAGGDYCDADRPWKHDGLQRSLHVPVPGLRALVITFWPFSGEDFRRNFWDALLECRREAAGPWVRPFARLLVFCCSH